MINYLLLIIFGLAPSLVWLFYFLRKDVHPEDNRQIIKIFIWGMLAVFPAILVQLGIFKFLSFFEPSGIKTILLIFIGVGLIEEFSKYLVVKIKIMKSSHLDEPIDLPLYMIISALGFAALENILVILEPGLFSLSPLKTIALGFFRFISATFLHALASGVLGIFMAAAYFNQRFKNRCFLVGLFLAVFLHSLYDFSIMRIQGEGKFLIPFLILINLAIVLSIGFKKIREMKSICKLEKLG